MEILTIKYDSAFKICSEKCLFKEEMLTGDSLNHTVYTCLANCSIKVIISIKNQCLLKYMKVNKTAILIKEVFKELDLKDQEKKQKFA